MKLKFQYEFYFSFKFSVNNPDLFKTDLLYKHN